MVHFMEVTAKAPGVPKKPIEITDDQIEESLKEHIADVSAVGTDFQLVVGRPGVIPTALQNEAAVMYITQQVNDMHARAVGLHPDRFTGMVTLPQVAGGKDMNLIVEEVDRCVEQHGFVGVKINCDPGEGGIRAPDLGNEYWYPLYEKMVQLDLPGLLHGGPYFYSREMEVSVYPGEVTIGGWALLRTPQVFKDFPNLKIIVGHGGGFMPYQFGRARNDRLVAMAADSGLESFEESMSRLYFDTVIYNPESVEYMIDVVGVEHTLFGTDKPASGDVIDPKNGRPMNDIKNYIDAIPWLSDADRFAIYEGNARKLFTRLKTPAS
jgi:4-oxalmesaconate hydratase